MSWDPAQYLKFSQPRLRPALELLARVPLVAPRVIYDLGCGTGSMTRIMAQRWPQARITGIDDSSDMLQRAGQDEGNLRWLQQDIASWEPSTPADLIYSNAALHWLPDHARLLGRLIRYLIPDGVLAVQMPRNFSAPSHRAVAEAVRAGPWRARLEPLLRHAPVAEPQAYLDLLSASCREVDLWETQYFQVLRGEHPVLEWIKGTWLQPLLMALPVAERTAFEQDYARRVAIAYPPRPDGTTVLPFLRLFFVARRA